MREARAIGTLSSEERVRLGAAGLRTFFRIADRWGLGVADQCALLGDIGRTTHHSWRATVPETPESYPTDRLTRLSYLAGIHGLLQRLYGESPAYADRWVAAPNVAPPFDGESPLAFMRQHGIPGMHVVRRRLEAEAGGGLADADEWDRTTPDAEARPARRAAGAAR